MQNNAPDIPQTYKTYGFKILKDSDGYTLLRGLPILEGKTSTATSV